MKLTNIFNDTCTQQNTPSFWPSCSQHPKTLSFRSIHCDDQGLKDRRVSNISYNNDSFDQPTRCSKTALMEDLWEDEGIERMERVIRGLKSDRLFFEPGETNSILGEAKKYSSNSKGYCSNVEKSATLLPIESLDPYLDFKKSMVEMVEAHGVKGWDWLQELLGCYLEVNDKRNHEFIIGAFVDLLLGLDLESLELMNCSSFVASSSSLMRFSSSDDISISFCSTSTSNLPIDHQIAPLEKGVD